MFIHTYTYIHIHIHINSYTYIYIHNSYYENKKKLRKIKKNQKSKFEKKIISKSTHNFACNNSIFVIFSHKIKKLFIHTYTYIHIHIHLYIYIYIYTYIYIHRHTRNNQIMRWLYVYYPIFFLKILRKKLI